MSEATLQLFLEILSQMQVSVTSENADEAYAKLATARDEVKSALNAFTTPKETAGE